MTSIPIKSKFTLACILFLVIAIIMPVHSYSMAQSGSSTDLSTLPLTFPGQSTEVIDYFNSIAQPNDVVSIPNAYINAVPEVKAGQAMVSFASWNDAQKVIPGLLSQIKWVLYDPEHWANTPTSEQQNLPTTVKNAAEYLHSNNLRLFLAPDRRFVDEYLNDFAPNVDALLLQGQLLQNDTALFASWITEKITIARTANPKILIYVQVAANRGTPEEMLKAIQSVSDQLNGIAIWSTPPYLDTLKGFIGLLRPTSTQSPTETTSLVASPTPPSSTQETTRTPSSSTPNYGGETTVPTSLSPTPTPVPSGQGISFERLALIFLSFMVIVLAALTAVLATNLRKRRKRSG
jgi:hypothetical protein